MRYNEEDVQNIIQSLDIVDVIGKRIQLKKSGANYKGNCPFHNEKTPSFTVTPSKNIYKCFGCGETGGALSFYMKMNNMEFIQAIENLAKEYSFQLREVEENSKNRETRSIREKYFKILEEASEYFKDNLFSDKGREALKYFTGRGLTVEFIRQYNLGFTPDGWDNLLEYMRKKGYSLEELAGVGLAKKGDRGNYDVFRNRVMFPINSFEDKVIGFGGRIMGDTKDIAKYLNSPETEIFNKGKNLYGLLNRGEKIRKKNYAILVEGYMDVLTAHFHGFDNAVASLGTAFTEEQAKLLKRMTNNIVLAYDMDDAGRKAVERVSFILKKFDFNIRVLVLENAKDPDEFLSKFGREKFIKQVRDAVEIFDFLYKTYAINFNLGDVIGKRKFVEKFSDFFKSISNRVEENIYIDKLAANLDLNKDVLRESLVLKAKQPEIKTSFYAKKRVKIDLLEKDTVRLILKDKKYYKYFSEKDIINQIKEPIFVKVLEKLEQNMLNTEIGEDIEKEILSSEELSDDEKRLIIDEYIYKIDDLEIEDSYFEDIIASWERKKYLKELEEIQLQMSKTGIDDDTKRALTYRYFELMKNMKN